MGGAMDLVCSPGSNVIVTMDHVAKDGTPKIVDHCSLPLTGHNVVNKIITNLAVFHVDSQIGLTLIEIAPHVSIQELRNVTGCDFQTIPEPIPIMD
jgi:3-oxoacid CoA-transferase